jgi:hypothetical protein
MASETTQNAHLNPDVLVLGGGAAGLMCAATAGRRGRRVTLIDHADRVGKKILISGGGRANFTNLNCRAENFLSENPHFAKSALAAFTPADMVALVEKHGIPYHEKTLGQLFCDRSAQDLVRLLEAECVEANVLIRTSTRVVSIAKPGRFRVETSAGTFTADALVVATGGLSIPKMGATGLGYEIARQFGLEIVPCRPALVPLVFAPEAQATWCDLAGLSADAVVRASSGQKRSRAAEAAQFREKILITHRGLSGPAILQISSYWRPGEPLSLDLAPGQTVTAPLLLPNARRDLAAAFAALRSVLPMRLAERWLQHHTLATGKDFSNAALAQLEQSLHHWQVLPGGTEGYAKAEVTAGGVSTAALNAKTLEARNVPGLYFIGEVVDVTGWLGGYNFQWAWASATQAGRAV